LSGRVLHPDLPPEERRRLFYEGIDRFNGGLFYEAHDSWEEIWRSTTPEPRDLFQGLVQVTAGMHHALDRQRPEPAARVLAKGRRRLEPLAPVCLGLDLEALLESVRDWEGWLTGDRTGAAPPVPRIRVVVEGAVC
jgi:predicted metal-dependent hydrolase